MSGNIVDFAPLELRSRLVLDGTTHHLELELDATHCIHLVLRQDDGAWAAHFVADDDGRARFLALMREWLELDEEFEAGDDDPEPARVIDGRVVLTCGPCHKVYADEEVWYRWRVDFQGPSLELLVQENRVQLDETRNSLGAELLYRGLELAMRTSADPGTKKKVSRSIEHDGARAKMKAVASTNKTAARTKQKASARRSSRTPKRS